MQRIGFKAAHINPAITVECPSCKQPPGFACISREGREITSHLSRLRAANPDLGQPKDDHYGRNF